ncbi:PREDICTED: type-2 angiotensin II receptor [Nanorana parkeri]|uniref:type-2 angiotensin II receptor n=1 Tax=Nanorana parkeri TaxID=125878 RepID=UPI00085486A6|nr:PREDICTED: type-2 angiotensin II receptor [Nanorana parkeri]
MSENLTSNLTTTTSCTNNTIEGYQMDLLPVFYSFICIFGFIGNSIVITVLCLQRDMKTVANIYIVNLAIADLLFLVMLPFWATYYAFGLNWMFGKVMCKISSSLLTLNLFASIFFITCMSIDRYMAIVYPLRSQRRTLTQATIVALSVWALAIMATLPTFHFRNTYYLENLDVHACIMDFPANNYSSWCVAMSLLKITLGFCVPVTVIITCYLKIGLHFKKSKGPMLNQQSRDRALKIVTAIVVCFLVCWLPFHILTFLDVLTRMEVIKDCKTETLVEAALPLSICLAFSNSCINPLLYCFVGNQFRENFRHVLSSIKVLQSKNSQHNSSRKGSDIREMKPNGPRDNPPV